MNIGMLPARHARYRPNHTAVVSGDQRLTFSQFNRRINRLANALSTMGIGKGDKIATVLPNCLPQLEAYWAAAKIGAVVVPLSPLLRGQGLTRLLVDSDAVALITDAAFSENLTPLKPDLPAIPSDRYIVIDERAPHGYRSYGRLTAAASDGEPPFTAITGDDPYNIIYSSGTTGLPKGIVLTHAIRAHYCTGFASAFRFTPESVVLHAGSIVFNGAFVTLMPALYLGCTYILHRQFDVEAVIETIEREGVTHMMMVPAQMVALLHSANFSYPRLKSLEMLCSIGAPLHRTHKDHFNEVLPGRFYELYGLTEGLVTILDREEFGAKPDSVGTPLPFYEMKIVDKEGNRLPPNAIGEIVSHGPSTTPGYYKRPDLTAQSIRDGWVHTGDLGYVDEDGFLYLVDRMKEMIISGGVNVYPRDIEEVMVQHPAVREVAVFGVPSERWGETPLAVVILVESAKVAAEELRDWTNERVDARFQRVHDVIIADELPRNAAGKTLKRVLREQMWAGRGPAA